MTKCWNLPYEVTKVHMNSMCTYADPETINPLNFDGVKILFYFIYSNMAICSCVLLTH